MSEGIAYPLLGVVIGVLLAHAGVTTSDWELWGIAACMFVVLAVEVAY